MTVNAHERTYKANTSHLEYVKYLYCTLYVLTPKSVDRTENDTSETILAAISDPSGCGVAIKWGDVVPIE